MAQFTMKPNYVAVLTETPRFIEASFGGGYTQRTFDGLNTTPRIFQLKFSNLKGVDLTTLRTFFANLWASGSVASSFTWIPPRPIGDGSTLYKFLCRGPLQTTMNEEERYDVTAVFEEVFE